MKTNRMQRREFIKTSGWVATGAALAGLPSSVLAGEKELAVPTFDRLPRWRGFNLLEKFDANHQQPFLESDYAWLAELGFNFTRLPLSYRCWSAPTDWGNLRDESLKEVDQAVAYGRQYGIHVNLNFHRAPGYCVNPPKEPLSLWEDETALAACAHHWAQFAKRYRDIPNTQVSFDLLNEPPDIPEATYRRVVQRLVEAIRQEDPDRLIIADGLKWGTQPVPSLKELKVAQSTRGYTPMRISHHQASWIGGSNKWDEPSWPLLLPDGKGYDKERLRKECVQPWVDLQAKGVGVHVGEWGAFNRTPHPVVLAWMRDQLDLWKAAGWGWSVWNFRGAFGPLDSSRSDVVYEDFHGHKLDRKMMDLLTAG